MIPITKVSHQKSRARRGGEISLLVLHHTAGHWKYDLKILRGLTATDVSVHWLVGRTPEQGIVAIVPEHRTAYHAGKAKWTTAGGHDTSAINDISLGIELSRPPDCPPFTAFQYEATAQLCRFVMRSYPLITWERIVGHYHVSPGRKTDPNPGFDWERLKDMVMGTPVKLEVDGEAIADEGRLVDGTTWVPVRVVAQAAGRKVIWKGGQPPTVALERDE